MKWLIAIFLFSSNAYPYKFKVRAREHYEIHKITSNALEATYKGFSNTLNFWWEKPYDISFGFSFSPILASLKYDDNNSFGDNIKYFNIGFEVKYFLQSLLKQLYIRPGIHHATLKPGNNLENRKGLSAYLGLGYEIPLSMFGLALELGYRHANLSKSTEIKSVIPSIGFHFYEYF